MDNLVRWAPLLGPMFAVVIAVLGWYVAHRLNISRDRTIKRNDMIIQYLLEAYRRLELAANRKNKTEEINTAFESAVADIQLLGSPDQISEITNFIYAQAESEGASIDNVLSLLRNDLRKELKLPTVEGPPKIFRFIRQQGAAIDKGSH